jgi:hypothetical protein
MSSSSKLVSALQQQEEEYVKRPPLHLRTSKSSTIRHNLLLSPTRTTSGSLRGIGTNHSSRRRTISLTTAAGGGNNGSSKKDLKLLPRLEEENANLPPQVTYPYSLFNYYNKYLHKVLLGFR